jgi:hypothetical protein
MIALALCTLFSLAGVSSSRAAEDDKKADPSGTWTWTTPGRNGGADRKMTLKLKVEGDKVTGTLSSPGQGGEETKSEIENGKIQRFSDYFNLPSFEGPQPASTSAVSTDSRTTERVYARFSPDYLRAAARSLNL